MNVLLTVMVQNVVYGEPDGGNTTDFDSMRSFSSASVWMFGLMVSIERHAVMVVLPQTEAVYNCGNFTTTETVYSS